MSLLGWGRPVFCGHVMQRPWGSGQAVSLLCGTMISQSRNVRLLPKLLFRGMTNSKAETAWKGVRTLSQPALRQQPLSTIHPFPSGPPLPTPSGDEETDQLVKRLHKVALWKHGVPTDQHDSPHWNPAAVKEVLHEYDQAMERIASQPRNVTSETRALMSPEAVNLAFKALLKCQYGPEELSNRVRRWERFLGAIKQTPLTDHLSLRLLTANGKAGNVGRVLSLLQLRKARKYPPRRREFVNAIISLQAANHPNRKERNIFMSDRDMPVIDNPTRWLDAILLNMSERGFPLDTAMANLMLQTYSAGRTGKAVHHFYRIHRQPLATLTAEEAPTVTDEMPKDWFHIPSMEGYKYQPVKIKLKFNRSSPPHYKVPSQVKGKLVCLKNDSEGMIRSEQESEPNFSAPLSAAFAFCDSLQHGACGHKSITLNVGSYNALIKASVYRGALWRAMHVLDTLMPANQCPPNTVSYNLLLSGFSAVGDISMTQEYYRKLLNDGLAPNAFTVRAIVDGLLNHGDLGAAITVVQDFFNQHNVLPPYTTHIKILEFCLASGTVYEAKRHVYFLQQLWYWQPNDYHSEEFVRSMKATQSNPQLKRPALEQLFSYFGEELTDDDFI